MSRDTCSNNIAPKVYLTCFLYLPADNQEKEILNAIILAVTVVASLIIVGIIVLFVYKKRQSFRDIMPTRTAVAKSNSYKSNVGCEYSNLLGFWFIQSNVFTVKVNNYYNVEQYKVKSITELWLSLFSVKK